MGDIVTQIFSSFTSVITSLSLGIKSAFSNILYEDPTATAKVISAPIQFGLIFMGITMALGLVYGAIKMIKKK